MNPLDELNSLTRLFPGERRLIEKAEHLPSALVPEPYKQLLDHSTLLFPCSAMVKSDETFRRNMRM